MKTIAIGIGTNQGDRIRSMSSVLEKMLQQGFEILQVSSLYESQAVGYESDNLFLNAVIKIQTHLDPEEVLHFLMQIEAEMGRVRQELGYADRPMDLDILAVEEEIIHTEILQVPHPRMHERAFVLIPFQEVWSDWKHPQKRLKITELCQMVHNQKLMKVGVMDSK
jgi:2-amino-4-hydroxy-6-hydroxymethyldihydropteridine diphosphokinase